MRGPCATIWLFWPIGARPQPIAVIEQRFSNGVLQEILLENPTSSAGQNVLVARAFGPMGRDAGEGRLAPDIPSLAIIRRELRSRFNSCSEGLAIARKTRNVVVRDGGRRMGIDFAPPIRKILDETPVGKLSEPVPQARGLVMFAVCDKKIVRSANAAMKEIEPELTNTKGVAFSKQYLRQLKRDAVIERRG